jgi:hypothetical protein
MEKMTHVVWSFTYCTRRVEVSLGTLPELEERFEHGIELLSLLRIFNTGPSSVCLGTCRDSLICVKYPFRYAFLVLCHLREADLFSY